MAYTNRVQEIIRQRSSQLGLSLRDLVDRYVSHIGGLSNTTHNRKKKRNTISRIWSGNTVDPLLSTFVRMIESLGGEVIVRWKGKKSKKSKLRPNETLLSISDLEPDYTDSDE